MTDFDWTGWTDWTSLAALNPKEAPDGPGAYVIAADRPINRAVGTDPLGFLDAGESDSVRRRLKEFRRCATERLYEKHSAGYSYCFFRFDLKFPWETLRVRWTDAATKEDAYALEGRILVHYIKTHFELPPLNSKFNWTDFEKMNLMFAALGE